MLSLFAKPFSTSACFYVESLLTRAESVLSMLATSFSIEPPGIDLKMDRFFLECLKLLPNSLSFYVTLSDGSFMQVRRTENLKVLRGSLDTKLPPHAKYAIRKITKDSSGKAFTETWVYLDDELREVGKEVLPCTENSMTKRDWYINAESSKTMVWSDPYVFSTVKLSGVTLSMPLLDNESSTVTGVICVDFILDHLKKVLKSCQSIDNSQTYLISEKNEIVAASTETEIYSDKYSNNIDLIKVCSTGNSILEEATKNVGGSDEKYFQFTQDGCKYFVFVKKLNKLPLFVLSISPYKSFMNKVGPFTKEIMLLIIIILFGSIALGLVLTRKIAKPIGKLRDAAAAVSNMNLEDWTTLPTSNILEIKHLSNSINSLKLNVSTFAKYLPLDLVNKLIARGIPPVLGGKSTDITLLFTDIEKFSMTAENLPDEYLVLHLSEYFQAIAEKIMSYNGVIDKFIGDSVMAMWGAPFQDENHVINACYAGMKCQETLKELGEQWKSLGKPDLPTRIGIHSGSAIVGNIGSQDRMNYTAIGDAVNIASRLEGANKYYGTKILVSETVEAVAKSEILFRIIDKILVKGRRSGIIVYEPMCLMEDIRDDKRYFLIDLCARSKDAFELYQNCQFKDAIRIYDHLLRDYPELKASVTPILRTCLKYLENPPEDWNGINYLDEK
ncbi:MAG: hypothetical protein LBJ92_02395 [Holosporales bacterium]|nr:hypothetical protein [Holosporales bacterium]